MRTLLLLIACCGAQISFCQIQIGGNGGSASFLQTMQGQPITQRNATVYTDGSPFFNTNWLKATVITTDGGEYKDVPVRINLLEGNLHYKDASGAELINVSSLKEVIITDINARFVHASSIPGCELGNVWLQQLSAQGPARIYKQVRKDVKEMKAYGSATTELYVTDEKRYFLLTDNNLQKVKKLKDITDLLSTKEAELTRFIREQSLKDKAEYDMGRLVDYYNSLTKQ